MKIMVLQKRCLFSINLALLLNTLKKKKVDHITVFDESEDILEAVNRYKPDMALVHTTPFDLHPNAIKESFDMLELIKDKHPSVKTAICGTYSSFCPSITNKRFIDKAYVGDLEEVDWNANDERIVYAPSLIDLNALEMPTREIDFFLKYPDRSFRYAYELDFARGCPNRCSFCHNHKLIDHTKSPLEEMPRYYPARFLIDIARYIVERDPSCETLYFTYGTLTHSKPYFREFVGLYDQYIKIPYVCTTRLDVVDDEIAELLSHKCSKVTVGIESGNEKIRLEMLNKNLTDKQIFDGIRALKKYNLRIGANIVSGFGESLADYFDTLDFIKKLDVDFLNNTLYFPLEGTDLYKTYKPSPEIDARLINLTRLYLTFPSRTLIKILKRLPLDRLYRLIDNIPRIRAILKYDMGGRPFAYKIGYVLNAVKVALMGTKANLKFGHKIYEKRIVK